MMAANNEYVPSPTPVVRDQVELYERTSGREGNTAGGAPVVILTSVGAKSGSRRKNPVMRVEHEGRYAVVASLAGRPTNPMWYANLLSHPEVELQDGPVPVAMTAHEVYGEERELWWQRAVAAWPAYADYQQATERVIPVLVLEPSNSASPERSSRPQP